MRVGYARVSTGEQSMEAQLARLGDCDKVYSEKQSGGRVDRPQLNAALDWVRQGDVLVVTRLDRLARSVVHMCAIAHLLEQKGVGLVVLDQAIDTTTATGTLLFHVLSAIAEFERSIRMEAQRAGMAHAVASGKSLGRPSRLNTEEQAEVRRLAAEGVPLLVLARRYKVAKNTIRNYVVSAPTC